MKTALATLCFLLIFQGVYAQRWSLSLDGGASFPVGKFGKKDIYDSTAAFARVGPSLQLTADRRIGRHWGLSFSVAGEEHGVNTKAAVSKLTQADPSKTYTYTEQKWKIGKIMVGAFGEWKLGGPWSFTAKGYLGVLAAKYPDITGTTHGPGTAETLYERGYTGAPIPGPLVQVEAGIRYTLGKHLFLQGNLDASGAYISYGIRPSIAVAAGDDFGGITGTSGNPPIPSTSSNTQFIQPIWTLGVTIGLGIRI